MSGQTMYFPDTVEEFMERYAIVDSKQVYTNGVELVPIFRMKQWFERHPEPHWILCSERLPEEDGRYLVSHRYLTSIVLGHPDQNVYEERVGVDSYHDGRFFYHDSAVAWWSVPVPEPYKGVTE